MKRIMVIDDAESMRQILTITLKRKGYQVIDAENGLVALEKLQNEKIDLFICDVNMPKMNGLEFLEKLRTEGDHRDTPCIMLTTEVAEDLKEKGRELGSNGWIVKPFEPEDFLNKVKEFL